MAQVRKVPTRRCSGCGASFPKKELLRVVRAPDGSVSLDFTGKKSGRGVYVCQSSACFKKARRKGSFASALAVTIPDEVLDLLEREILHAEETAEGQA